MNFLDIMHSYFKGEKIEALYFILPAGFFLLVLGVVALKAEQGGFAWGVFIPSLFFGVLLIVTGLFVGIRAPYQVADIEKNYEKARTEMLAKELPRMQKVHENFQKTLISFGFLALLGLLFYFVVRADWAKGSGAVLVLAAGMGFLIDGFAHRRTSPYLAVLKQLTAEQISPSSVSPKSPSLENKQK